MRNELRARLNAKVAEAEQLRLKARGQLDKTHEHYSRNGTSDPEIAAAKEVDNALADLVAMEEFARGVRWLANSLIEEMLGEVTEATEMEDTGSDAPGYEPEELAVPSPGMAAGRRPTTRYP